MWDCQLRPIKRPESSQKLAGRQSVNVWFVNDVPHKGSMYEGHPSMVVSAFPLTGALEQTVRKPVNHEENVCANHLMGGKTEDRATKNIEELNETKT